MIKPLPKSERDLVELSNVWMSFEDKEILKGISLRVAPGKTCVIMGGSGVGKSVTLKLILGLLKPIRGEVCFDGVELGKLRESGLRAIRKRVGMVFQGGALFDSITVGENVGYRLSEQKLLPHTEIDARVSHCLATVGLPGIEEMMPANLSGGMVKRVAIARAIASKPDLLLFDEPTAGLDPINAHHISKLILRLRQQTAATSIVVTHDLDCAFTVATDLLMMYKGEIIFDGLPDEMRKSSIPEVHQFLYPDDDRLGWKRV